MPVLRPVSRFLPLLLVTLLTHCAVIPCAAEDDESLRVTISQLADPEAEVRTAAVETLARLRDPRILAVLEHYKKRSLLLWEGQLVLCPEMQTDDDGNRRRHWTSALVSGSHINFGRLSSRINMF